MKKTPAALFLIFAFLFGCKSKKNIPDVSGIPVTVKIERFDKAFFQLDSNNIVPGLQALNRQFPYFTNDFTANIPCAWL